MGSELSVLEKLQQLNHSAEFWWDSSPLDFPRWKATVLGRAPDSATQRRWTTQLNRFFEPDNPGCSLIRGVTTNPSLIAKSIMVAPELWTGEIHRQAARHRLSDAETVFRHVYQEAARRAAEATLPLWRRTDGRYGWVSVQLDPRLMFDSEAMLEQAMQLASLAANVMVKVPGTKAGYAVIQQLVRNGIAINNTLTYTVPQFVECIRAVESGLDAARRTGIRTDRWRAVVTYMIGRYGSSGDLPAEAAQRQIPLSWSDVRWAEIAVLKRIQQIIAAGKHPVKMLLSSLEVDDPAAGATSLSMHLQQTAGADLVYTCKPAFVEALMRRECELQSLDPTAFDVPVPADVLNRLKRLPYFCRAIEPDGMAPHEFCSHGAFITTHAEVNCNVRRLIDFIAHRLEDVTPHQPRSR